MPPAPPAKQTGQFRLPYGEQLCQESCNVEQRGGEAARATGAGDRVSAGEAPAGGGEGQGPHDGAASPSWRSHARHDEVFFQCRLAQCGTQAYAFFEESVSLSETHAPYPPQLYWLNSAPKLAKARKLTPLISMTADTTEVLPQEEIVRGGRESLSVELDRTSADAAAEKNEEGEGWVSTTTSLLARAAAPASADDVRLDVSTM